MVRCDGFIGLFVLVFPWFLRRSMDEWLYVLANSFHPVFPHAERLQEQQKVEGYFIQILSSADGRRILGFCIGGNTLRYRVQCNQIIWPHWLCPSYGNKAPQARIKCVCLFVCLSVCVSIVLYVCLCVFMCACVCVCLCLHVCQKMTRLLAKLEPWTAVSAYWASSARCSHARA